jgi:hypothetical protein
MSIIYVYWYISVTWNISNYLCIKDIIISMLYWLYYIGYITGVIYCIIS